MKKILVASDSFKGSLSSLQVAEYAAEGIRSVLPDCIVEQVCVADGGEGTVEALVDGLGGEYIDVTVSDPLFRPNVARYGMVEDRGRMTAVMEMASASGLPLLSENERNPMKTSTYGTGEMIADAMARGCRRFLIGIGGSATNDGGIGMLAALGFRFLDSEGNILPCIGASLGKISLVDASQVHPAVAESEFVVACDVTAPFCGKNGAAYVFAHQKGADYDMIVELDAGLESFANVILGYNGTDVKNMPGAGAAGGLGGAFKAFLNAELKPGVDMVLDAVGFDGRLEGCSLVITGEGRIDRQTAMGKTPAGVLRRASLKSIPVVAIGGCVGEDIDSVSMGFAGIFPILPSPVSLEEAMQEDFAGHNVMRTVSQIVRLLINTGYDE